MSLLSALPLTFCLCLFSTLFASAASPHTAHSIISPVFIGFLTQRYEVHNVQNNSVYNLLTDPDTLINGRFHTLSPSNCASTFAYQCFTQPGSYITEISIQTSHNDRVHIAAGTQGFSSLTINQHSCYLGVFINTSSISIKQLERDRVLIIVGGLYSLELHNDDEEGFIHVDSIQILNWKQLVTVNRPHGLIGQTWRRRKLHRGEVNNPQQVVEGSIADYEITEHDIYGSTFKYDRFKQGSRERLTMSSLHRF